MEKEYSTSVEGLEFDLWRTVPANSWLRTHGRTRVVLIDDQLPSRSDFFPVENDESDPCSAELYFSDWLNIDFQFFPMPADYEFGPSPKGTFNEDWFRESLQQILTGERSHTPIAAILLDLMFGGEESSIEDASGVRFLRIIREELPDVPVLVFSNLEESHQVFEKLKMGHDEADEDASFEDYIPKQDPNRLRRIAEKLVFHADLTDPSISAYSASMRRVAKEMRQVVLTEERMRYENTAETYPTPVTFIGEIGSGKNFLAERIAKMSSRRSNPIERLAFSDVGEDDAIKKLCGVGPYTDAPFLFYTDTRNGAILEQLPRGARKQFPTHIQPLGAIGILQRADMGDGPHSGGGEPSPRFGTVILDELGAAPHRIQQTLISVFNRGQFNPEQTSLSIPTERQLDLWFLIPCTPDAFDRIIGDIRSRLTRSRPIHIPALAEREEDILPLAMVYFGDTSLEHPIGRLFTRSAGEWLLARTKSMQVRDFIGVLASLKRRSGRGRQIIFNARDIKSAIGGYLRDEESVEGKSHDSSEQVELSYGLSTTIDSAVPRVELHERTTLPNGGQLDGYQLISQIGSGGMGTVYRAHQTGLDREVAIKVLRPGVTDTQIERFRSEAKAVASLDHPGIIKIFDVGEVDVWRYFSMELVTGSTLAEKAATSPVSCPEAARIIAKAADAIHHAHEANVIHRDIKPSNILMKQGEPILTDFGLVKLVNSDLGVTRSGDLVGTVGYMSPEQTRGEKLGPSADIYSLGVTLYRILLLRTPFANSELVKLITMIQGQEPPRPRLVDPSIDAKLEAVCMKCLKKEPAERYATATELSAELYRFLSGSEIEAELLPQLSSSCDEIRAKPCQLSVMTASLLDYLARAVEEVEAENGTLSAVLLWRFISGTEEAIKTNNAKGNLAKLLTSHHDEELTRMALSASAPLMRLARLVSNRSDLLKRMVVDDSE
ncbi:MAG: protein kinase [Planctomycetota bacterium]